MNITLTRGGHANIYCLLVTISWWKIQVVCVSCLYLERSIRNV
jgi:hypothetical protein